MDLSKTSFGTNKPDEPLTLAELKQCVDDAIAKGAPLDLPVFVRVTNCEGDLDGDGGLTAARNLTAGTGYGKCFMLDAHADVGEERVEALDVTLSEDDGPVDDEDEPVEEDEEEPGVMDILDDPMAKGYDGEDEEDEEDEEE